MAALIVQRPSPESETRLRNCERAGSFTRLAAVRSSSHEAITLPRRQTSADVAQIEIVLIKFRIAQRRGFRIDGVWVCLPTFAPRKMPSPSA